MRVDFYYVCAGCAHFWRAAGYVECCSNCRADRISLCQCDDLSRAESLSRGILKARGGIR